MQPAECPICSWVNSTTKPIPVSFDSYPRRKKVKGIVYYQDRLQQVVKDPSLTACSPIKQPLTVAADRRRAVESCSKVEENPTKRKRAKAVSYQTKQDVDISVVPAKYQMEETVDDFIIDSTILESYHENFPRGKDANKRRQRSKK